jgi:hypothetical protein
MVSEKLSGIFDVVIEHWESKRGLLYTTILLILAYRCFLFSPIQDLVKIYEYSIIIQILFFLSLWFLLFIYWKFSTNRYLFRRNEFKYVGISVSGEEIKEKIIVRKILNRIKNEINREFNKSKLCVKILPFNYINSQSELNKYFGKSGSQYDVLMVLNTESGNYEEIEKLKIKKIWSIFLRLGSEVKRKIHFFDIDYNLDIAIQGGTKDWNYTISNDGNDKKKYFSNIYDLILFYTSLHLSYMNEFKQAYELILPICDPSKSKAIPINVNGKKQFRLSPVAISYGRKNNMFIDLTFKESIRHRNNNDWKSFVEVFKTLDSKLPLHKYAYYQKICLARGSYEIGNMTDAVRYTNEAQNLKSNGVEVYLNLGFFGILNNNATQLVSNYNKLFNKRNQLNESWADIIDFLLREKEKKDNNLYNFAIGFIYKVFVGTGDSKEFLDAYFNSEPNPPEVIVEFHSKINRDIGIEQMRTKKIQTKTKRNKRRK